MKRLYALVIAGFICMTFMHPVLACMKFGESIYVSLANRGSEIDFDRLKLFFLFTQNEPDELRYQSASDQDLVVLITRYQWENEKKAKKWGYDLLIRPRSYENRAMHDFRKALKVELERLMKNGILTKFSKQDLNDILSLETFGDMVSYKGQAGISWESQWQRDGECGGPVELEGEIPALTLPL